MGLASSREQREGGLRHQSFGRPRTSQRAAAKRPRATPGTRARGLLISWTAGRTDGPNGSSSLPSLSL